MIFITKKAFENEIEKRIGEIHFKTRTDEELWKLKDEVRDLQHRVEMLEARNLIPTPANPVYEPAPYWTNPNWKAPDFTCTNPPQTQCDTPIRDTMTGATTCTVPQMDIVKDAVKT